MADNVDPRQNPDFGLGLLYLLDSLGQTLANAEAQINGQSAVIDALKAAHRERASDDSDPTPDESPVGQHDGSTLPPDEEEPRP